MRLALYQPDIPQNTGTMMRLCACLGVPMDVIEPCGFVMNDKNLRRAGMDYLDGLDLVRHASWDHFVQSRAGGRVVLLTTKTDRSFLDFSFQAEDVLLLGRESAGVPDDVHAGVEARVTIPMVSGMRSLNVAISAAIVLTEALRQTSAFPILPAT